MHRFIDGEDRRQPALLPHSLEDYVGEENPVRVIEVFIDELDLAAMGFSGMTPAATGRPAYHPSTLLKIYLYGYLNRIQSSRRLEREAQRNIELMWLVGRLAPDFKRSRPSSRCKLEWSLRWPSIRPPGVEVSPDQRRSAAV
jgi:transposase